MASYSIHDNESAWSRYRLWSYYREQSLVVKEEQVTHILSELYHLLAS